MSGKYFPVCASVCSVSAIVGTLGVASAYTIPSVDIKLSTLEYAHCDKYWTINNAMHYTNIMDSVTQINIEPSRTAASFAMVFGPEIYDTRLTPGARLLKIGLSFRCANNYAKNFVSYQTLADDFGVSDRTIKNWAKELKDLGILRCVTTEDGLTLKVVRAPEDTYGETFVRTFRRLFSNANRNLSYLQCHHLQGVSTPVSSDLDIDASKVSPGPAPIKGGEEIFTGGSEKDFTLPGEKDFTPPSEKDFPLNRSSQVDESEVEETKYTNASEARFHSGSVLRTEKTSRSSLTEGSYSLDKNREDLSITDDSEENPEVSIRSEKTSGAFPSKKRKDAPSKRFADIDDDDRVAAAKVAMSSQRGDTDAALSEARSKRVARTYGEQGARARESRSTLRTQTMTAQRASTVEKWWKDAMNANFRDIPVAAFEPRRIKDINNLLRSYSVDTINKLIDYIFANWNILCVKFKWQQPGKVPDFGFLLRNHEKLIGEVDFSSPRTEQQTGPDDGLF